MQELIPSTSGGVPQGRFSPFDAIKHVDEDGEYWLARELMIHLGYAKWENFVEAIKKARTSIESAGDDPDWHASWRQEASGRTLRDNYRLTRHGAYITAQNGDVRKKQIAEAQQYFSYKTNEAEQAEAGKVAAPVPAPTFPLINLSSLDPETLAMLGQFGQALTETSQALIAEKAVTARQAKALEAAQHKAEVAESKAEYVDSFVDPGTSNTLFRTFCGQIDAPERKLREHLQAKGIIYRKLAGREWSKSEKRWREVHEWHAHAAYKKWFHKTDQPDAPRLHNNQMRTTLYVTPVGKVAIQRWLQRNPIEGAK
jgi:hypothetical protein